MENHRHQTLLFLPFTLLLLQSSVLGADHCNPDDKKALFRIKEAFQNDYQFASWTNDSDCCSWYMLKCDQKTHRVTDIFITDSDTVNGTIPDAIGDLPYLTFIRFSKLPKLTGPIPESLTRLKNLNYPSITYTNISGSIPDFIGDKLTKLTSILLSVNNLTGPIPPSLSKLKSLRGLYLDRNRLTGSIPDNFGGFMNNPDFYLQLTKNQLSGPIPKSLGTVNFTIFDLSRNGFTGDALFLFGKNKGLQIVDLSRNKFSFNMTNLKVPESLTGFDVSHNMIYGSIPPAFGKQTLYTFNVSYNRLCGPVPTGIDLDQFDQYDFAHNKCLCGSPLPPCT